MITPDIKAILDARPHATSVVLFGIEASTRLPPFQPSYQLTPVLVPRLRASDRPSTARALIHPVPTTRTLSTP
jgi:hypothetical protein